MDSNRSIHVTTTMLYRKPFGLSYRNANKRAKSIIVNER